MSSPKTKAQSPPKANAPAPMQLTIQPPGPEVLSFAEEQYQLAEVLRVESPQESIEAQQFRAKAQTAIKRLIEQRLAITRPIDVSKKLIMDLFQKPIDLLTLCVRQADRTILQFDDAQREAARQRQLIENAKAEKELARLAKLQEKAQVRGDLAKADEFAVRQESHVAPVVEVESPQAKGASFVETWTFEITDAKKIKPEFMMPDEVKIGKQVRALHMDAQSMIGEGITIRSSRGLATRRTT